MNLIKAIFKKEFKDSIRDRRALMVAILPALLAPILMSFMFHMIAKTKVSTEELTIQVIGQENAPDLIQYLINKDVKVEAYEGEPKKDIQDEKVKLVLEIPDDYAENFSESKPAVIFVHADSSMSKSRAVATRVNRLLSSYSSSIGALRLIARGVNPKVSQTLSVQGKDYSTNASRAGQILAGLQMFILMAAFFGSASVAIDTTAGERERKSLEPLLVHPVTSMQLIFGKWLTVICFGIFATIIAVITTGIALDYISLKSLGLDPKLTVSMQLSIILLLIPSALFAAGLQMLTSLFAKSFKEAQSYLGLVSFIPMAPVIATMVAGAKASDWMYFVPILGQQQLLTNVLRGDGINWVQFAATSSVTIFVALLFVLVLVKLLRSERVVYGN